MESNMKNPLKYKEYKKVRVKDNITSYLYEESIKSCGVFDVKDGVFKTHDNKKFASFKYDFNTPYGLDKAIDNENLIGTTMLVNALECDFSLTFMSEVKKLLDGNIEYFEEVLNNTNDPVRKDLLERHIDVMKFYNDEKNITQIIEVDERFCEILSRTGYVLNLHRMNDEEIIQNMFVRCNDME